MKQWEFVETNWINSKMIEKTNGYLFLTLAMASDRLLERLLVSTPDFAKQNRPLIGEAI